MRPENYRSLVHCPERVEVETDGTIMNSTAAVVGADGSRRTLSCVVGFEGCGERLAIPDFRENGDIITLHVRGVVWRRRAPGDPSVRCPLEKMPGPLTADFLWTIHRAALGGRSSVTGAELPASLAETPPGARAAHYAMALAAARHVDPAASIPMPEGVSPEEAVRIAILVDEVIGA